MFLGENGTCQVYDRRPLECRIFPFDIWIADRTPLWLLWYTCPASAQLFNREQALASVLRLEQQFFYTGEYGEAYTWAYDAYHQEGDRKYDDDNVGSDSYQIIRPVCFSMGQYQAWLAANP